MANEYAVNHDDLKAVAKAIREKGETTEVLTFPAGFISAVEAISGGGLNFEVVGGTERPENPKENTIWINTDQEITGWTVSLDDPFLEQVELYHNITLTSGYYIKSDGSNGSSSTWRITENIPLPDGTESIIVRTGASTSTGVYHAFFDASGKRLSLVLRNTGTSTYDVPDGAASVKLSIRSDDTPSLIAVCEVALDDGLVWIRNSEKSPAVFNAIDDNELLVYPYSCKQFVSGRREDRPVSVYLNGQWIDVWSNILYDSGNEYIGITGGWETITVNGLSLNANAEKTDDGLYIHAYNNTSSAFITGNAVDLSEFTTLHFTVKDVVTSFRVGISTSKNAYYEDSSCVATLSVVADGTYSIPLSSLGKCYLWIGLYTSSSTTYSGKLTKMWLE